MPAKSAQQSPRAPKASPKATCDKDTTAKKFWMNNYGETRWYDDIFGRNYRAIMNQPLTPNVYECGFPCQPFSVFRALEGMTPDLFILENVEGLLIHRPNTLAAIVKRLRERKSGYYNVHLKLLNSVDHGVPQNRKRLWFVGIAKKIDKNTFTWPADIGSVKIDDFLDPGVKEVAKSMPPKSSAFAWQSFLKLMKDAVASGLNPLKETLVMDIESTKPGWMGRRAFGRMGKMDMNPHKMGQLIGNAQSANVLERILFQALPAAGIIPQSELKGRWETRAAAAKTVASFSK
ncbi:unnamed protein product [Prorocentrum cordatum]|uniref:DNA (cytosine-5-)-methyltransferase n=1 Tax=Prorocentrum cordatum TaxID=2364126 RepID=A0ABN9V950_9DINO|nr:unnamed protein product [Polarella glacialis]